MKLAILIVRLAMMSGLFLLVCFLACGIALEPTSCIGSAAFCIVAATGVVAVCAGLTLIEQIIAYQKRDLDEWEKSYKASEASEVSEANGLPLKEPMRR